LTDMKHLEFYIKYKTGYPPIVNTIFSKRNWWRIALITVLAILIEPLVIMYKHQRSVPISLDYYMELTAYFLFIVIPFVGLLFWLNRRERTKQKRGYGWVGKFEVIEKQSLVLIHYLLLAPGTKNKVKVNWNLFEKTRVGDFILIRRDALGGIDEIIKVNNFSSRLSKIGTRRSSKSTEPYSIHQSNVG
jgi:hypothetical protein